MIATIKGEHVYGLDFYFYKMDLKDTPFEVEIEKETTILRASYFGMSNEYGNGAICIRNSMYNPEDLEPCDKMADEKDYAELFKTIFGKYPNNYRTKERMTKDFVINCLELKAHSISHTMPVNTEIPVYERAIELLKGSITFDELKEKIDKYGKRNPNSAGLFEATCKDLGILKE